MGKPQASAVMLIAMDGMYACNAGAIACAVALKASRLKPFPTVRVRRLLNGFLSSGPK